MPELPEVETTLKGIQPDIQGQMIQMVTVRHYQLRWPIPSNIVACLRHKKVVSLARRGKYLIMQLNRGAAIIHLGMSGRLRILKQHLPPQKHDHIDIEFKNGKILRFTDPRRFGAFLWTPDSPDAHPLLANLGVEPFSRQFSKRYLENSAKNKKIAVKNFIMDSKIVVGVGNIYAAEALFLAGIHPLTPVGQLTEKQFGLLVKAIRKILQQAIKQGGTTLKDFLNSEGKPGYFTHQLKVYGRAGLNCFECGDALKSLKIGQRSTVFCSTCQLP